MHEQLDDDQQRIEQILASVLKDSVRFLSSLSTKRAANVPPKPLAETLPQTGMGANEAPPFPHISI